MVTTNKIEINKKTRGNYSEKNLNTVIKTDTINKEIKIEESDVLDIVDENKSDNERNDEKIIESVNVENINKYKTRDESWLEFNTRILNLAKEITIPLFERFNFISIASSNLDEFITVRLPRLMECNSVNINNKPVSLEVKQLKRQIIEFNKTQETILTGLLNELKEETGMNIIHKKSELSEEEKDFIKRYFDKNIKSLLTPIVADNTKPFPLIKNKTISIGVILLDVKDSKNELFATIQIPDVLPRIIKVETDVKKYTEEEYMQIKDKDKANNVSPGNKFILIEDLIRLNLGKLFIDREIKNTGFFRILRDLNYKVNNDDFIVNVMKETLKRRDNKGSIIKIESNKNAISKIINKAYKRSKSDDNKSDIIDLSFCGKIKKLFNKETINKYTYDEFTPSIPEELYDCDDLLDLIDDEDILLHHPYDSYDTVVNFIKQASEDKNVLGIKQTLYRVSEKSPIMKALIRAAENGKQVTVVLEAKARFDEENNLKWAARLEQVGAQVVYGISDMKIHCKMCLVTKRKNGKLNNYVHIGTGNYNEINSKIYTDISLFTSRKNITEDVEKLFNAITGFSNPKLKRVVASPFNLKETLINNIDNEIAVTKDTTNNEVGYFVIKANGLTDKDIVDKIYEAAEAGVHVELIVRSSCSVIVRNNITIRSIIGRFLEHSRIWYFKHGIGDHKYYIGSSDLMPRNLYNRIEVMVPIDKENTSKIKDILDTYLRDFTQYANVCSTRNIIYNNCSSQEKFVKNSLDGEKIENINKFHIN